MTGAAGELVVAGLLVISGIFGLIGSGGLLKLDDLMKRLHAPTKATTVGVGTALIASVVNLATGEGRASWQELLIVIFLFATSPITAHFLSKAHLHRNLRLLDLPETGRSTVWSTFQTDDPAGPVPDAPDARSPASTHGKS